jgi:16S rRNA (cytosine1402-N4)-methyltransferase
MNALEKTQHIPVMTLEAVEMMQLRRGMTVVDATLGGGGYAKMIYEKIGKEGRLIALDQDQKAIDRFIAHNKKLAQKITTVHSNYSHIRKVLQEQGIEKVDAIVADLGVSSDQLNEADRGFSFKHGGLIDMRMDQGSAISALEIVNQYAQEDIAEIIATYGDEKFAQWIARAICASRPLETTEALAKVVGDTIPHSVRRSLKVHPATKTFQALRIAVNDEYRHLQIFLTEGIKVLRDSGRFVVVSFHSGEDRLVKNVFRTHARGCICAEDAPICTCDIVPTVRVVVKKPIVPSEEEVRQNPRARSARLRVVQKLSV